MKYMLLTLFGLCLLSLGYAQEKPHIDKRIPDNEYRISKMIDEFEEEGKALNMELKHLKSVRDILNANSAKLSKSIPTIKSLDDLGSVFRDFGFRFPNRSDEERYTNFELKNISRDMARDLYLVEDVYYRFEEEKSPNFEVINNEVSKAVDRVKNNLPNYISSLNEIEAELTNRLSEVESTLEQLYSHRGQSTDLHRIAINMGLPAFCLTILLLFLIPYYIERKNDAKDQTKNNKQYLLDVATVLLLTMTILILGLAKMITGEVLGTLLGGISGYVLNRTKL